VDVYDRASENAMGTSYANAGRFVPNGKYPSDIIFVFFKIFSNEIWECSKYWNGKAWHHKIGVNTFFRMII